MSLILIVLIAAAFYLAAGILAAKNIESGVAGFSAIRITLVLAIILNLFAVRYAYSSGELDFGISSALYWMTAIVALVYFLSTLAFSTKQIGRYLLPSCAACLLVGIILNPTLFSAIPAEYHSNPAFTGHMVVAVFAYAMLTLAAFQAVLLTSQERKLSQADKDSILDKMPPLQTMEKTLFQLVISGFVFLSLTLISGALFSQSIFGKPFSFTHHIVLASLAWLVFAVLIWGHFQRGWRGRKAARWTLCGFTLLLLGYFGTKIVQIFLS